MRMTLCLHDRDCQTSRYMQSWPDMVTPAGMRWPTPRAGIMVAGGSLNCYNYPWSKNLTAIPGGFLPCERPTGLSHMLQTNKKTKS